LIFAIISRNGLLIFHIYYNRNLDNNLNKQLNSYYSDNKVNNVEYVDENDEVLKSIGIPDYEGWLKKQGDKYKTWKNRFCILKGSNLYYLKSDKVKIISFCILVSFL
jgi:hypothetical protein